MSYILSFRICFFFSRDVNCVTTRRDVARVYAYVAMRVSAKVTSTSHGKAGAGRRAILLDVFFFFSAQRYGFLTESPANEVISIRFCARVLS